MFLTWETIMVHEEEIDWRCASIHCVSLLLRTFVIYSGEAKSIDISIIDSSDGDGDIHDINTRGETYGVTADIYISLLS